jgi:hypothetical protein
MKMTAGIAISAITSRTMARRGALVLGMGGRRSFIVL